MSEETNGLYFRAREIADSDERRACLEEAWSDDREGFSVWDFLLLGWSVLCIGFAAFFLGVFSGCMGAVHFLHEQGEESTIARCLKIVMPNALRLWAFHWVDGTNTDSPDGEPAAAGPAPPHEGALFLPP